MNITGLCNYVTNLPWTNYFNDLNKKVCKISRLIFLSLGSVLIIRYAPKIFLAGFLVGIAFPHYTADTIDRIWRTFKQYFPLFAAALILIPPLVTLPVIAFVISARIGAYLGQHTSSA